MKSTQPIRPLGVPGSTVLFFVPALILHSAHYFFVPAFVSGTGMPYLVGYLIAWSSTRADFLLAAWLGYRLEGNPIRWAAFRARFRLARLSGRDWLCHTREFLMQRALRLPAPRR